MLFLSEGDPLPLAFSSARLLSLLPLVRASFFALIDVFARPMPLGVAALSQPLLALFAFALALPHLFGAVEWFVPKVQCHRLRSTFSRIRHQHHHFALDSFLLILHHNTHHFDHHIHHRRQVLDLLLGLPRLPLFYLVLPWLGTAWLGLLLADTISLKIYLFLIYLSIYLSFCFLSKAFQLWHRVR